MEAQEKLNKGVKLVSKFVYCATLALMSATVAVIIIRSKE